jgi:hypothetical protein
LAVFGDLSAPDMPKPKANLPDWKDEPLKFAFNPDEALLRGAFANPPKVQVLKKSICAKSRGRR